MVGFITQELTLAVRLEMGRIYGETGFKSALKDEQHFSRSKVEV
jgi:hypothetical protein